VVKLEVSEEFKSLCCTGDEQIITLCDPIIWDLFGESNRFIRKRVSDDWYFNHNWLSLAIVAMDEIIHAQQWSEKEGKGIILDFRKNLTARRKKGQKLYLYLKFWAIVGRRIGWLLFMRGSFGMRI